MRGKITIGLLIIASVSLVLMFSGCVEEEQVAETPQAVAEIPQVTTTYLDFRNEATRR